MMQKTGEDRQIIEGEWPPFARLLTSHPSFSTSVSAQNSEALLLSFTSESNLLLLTVGLGVAAITLGTYISSLPPAAYRRSY